MFYLDTSLIIAALTPADKTAKVQDWLSAQAPEDLSVSDWSMAEVSSALSIKLRTEQVTLDQRAVALAAFNLAAQSFTILPISGSHFRTVARFADQHTLSLRAADALHLAIASEYGATVQTLDHRMAAAGPALGVPTALLA